MSDKLFPLRDFARLLLLAFCDGTGAEDTGDGRTFVVVDDDDTSAADCTESEAEFSEASVERTRFEDFFFLAREGICSVVLRPHVRHS